MRPGIALILALALALGSCISGPKRQAVGPGARLEEAAAGAARLGEIDRVMARDLAELAELRQAFFEAELPEAVPVELFRLVTVQCLNASASELREEGAFLCDPASLPKLMEQTNIVHRQWVTAQLVRVDAFRALSHQVRQRASKTPAVLASLRQQRQSHQIEADRLAEMLETSSKEFSPEALATSRERLGAYQEQIRLLDERIESVGKKPDGWKQSATKLAEAFTLGLVWLGQEVAR